MRRNSDSNSVSNSGRASSPTANDLTKRTIYEIQRVVPGSRMWRNNTGSAVPYATVRAAIAMLVRGQVEQALSMLRSARVITFGMEGQADITGIVPGGRRLEVEVKAGDDKTSPDQERFGQMIRTAGGIYVVSRDEKQAGAEVKEGMDRG